MPMLSRLFFALFLMFCINESIAQIDTIWVSPSQTEDIVITEHLQWFEDRSRSLDWKHFLSKDITSPVPFSFDTTIIKMPMAEKHWFRAVICTNGLDQNSNRFLYINHTYRTQLWQVFEDGQIDSSQTGELVRPSDLDSLVPDGNLKIEFKKEGCVLLIGNWEHYDRNFLRNSTSNLYFSVKTEKSMQVYDFMNSRGKPHFPMTMVFMGILGFLSVFMFLQFLQFKDKAYLSYALYTFSFFLFYLFRRSYWFPFPFAYIAEWRLFLEPYLGLLSILMYIYFLRSFLFIKKNTHPRIYRATQLFIYYIIAVWVLFPVVYWFSSSIIVAGKFFTYARSLSSIFIFYIIYFVFRLKGRLATYFIWGTMALALGGVISFINDLVKAHYLDKTGVRHDFQFAELGNVQIGILLECVIFALALGYRNYLVQQRKEEAEQQLGITKDRLNRAKLSPHFVFNALAAIKHLFQTGKGNVAVNYLVKFSSVLRYVLANLQKAQVPLSKELELADQYLALESLRFSDTFSYEIKVEEAINQELFFIPSLLLQPLLENAVQHGLIPLKEKKGVLKVIISKNTDLGNTEIRIEDNGIGRKLSEQQQKFSDHDSMGIELCRQRVAQIDTEATLIIKDLMDEQGDVSGTSVLISIPEK